MKYFFSCLLFLPVLAIAQSWDWVKAAGGDSRAGAFRLNQGTAIAADQLGSVYVGGYFGGTGVFGRDTLRTYTGCNPVLIKYDSAGHILWARQPTFGASDYCYGLCVDRAQNVCITGIEAGASLTAFTAKYDREGHQLWMNESQGEDCTAYTTGIVTDRVGNLYVAGYCKGVIQFDEIVLGEPEKYTTFLVKYDVNGHVLWAKHSAPSKNYNTESRSITIDADERIYIAGEFKDELSIDSMKLRGRGERDIFIAQFDNYGKLQWLRSIGGKGTDVPRGIAVDDQGNLYLTAFIGEQTKLKGKAVEGENLLKLNASGDLLWNIQVGVTEHDYSIASFVTLDKAGSPYLTGNVYGTVPIFGEKVIVSNGASDIFVAKCSPDGKVQWKLQAGGSGVDEGSAICIDSTHSIYVTGYFNDRADFGRKFIRSTNGGDGIWVGKITER